MRRHLRILSARPVTTAELVTASIVLLLTIARWWGLW